MKFLDNITQRLNRFNNTQKKILGISIGAILLIITLPIADDFGYDGSFDWEHTWGIWVIFIAIVGYFEYKLFS